MKRERVCVCEYPYSNEHAGCINSVHVPLQSFLNFFRVHDQRMFIHL